jgi:hypothetical protein
LLSVAWEGGGWREEDEVEEEEEGEEEGKEWTYSAPSAVDHSSRLACSAVRPAKSPPAVAARRNSLLTKLPLPPSTSPIDSQTTWRPRL